MSPPRRTLLVANPTAQSGRNAARIARARTLLDEAGVRHEFVPTLPDGGTVGAVANALRSTGYDTAVYMGGDGTFAEVAKGILASGRAAEVRLGMLPTGTANDQGKSFGLGSLDAELSHNVDVVAAGLEARLDAGKITGIDDAGRVAKEDWFFDSAGWGISPRILALRNEDRKAIAQIPFLRELYRDQMVYAGAMLRAFLESYAEEDAFDVEGTVDGARVGWQGLTDLVIKGTKIYGGIWVLDPASEPDDGRFEVVPFAHRADWLSKALLHMEHTGTLNNALAAVGVTHSVGTAGGRIELTFNERPGALPMRAQIDGEEFPATATVRVEVVPRALRLLVPEAHATSL